MGNRCSRKDEDKQKDDKEVPALPKPAPHEPAPSEPAPPGPEPRKSSPRLEILKPRSRPQSTIRKPTPLPKTTIMDSYEQIINEAPFSSIALQPITFKIDVKQTTSSHTKSVKTYDQKETQTIPGEEKKYFIHGNSSDIVACMTVQTHGCIDSSVTQTIDDYIQMFQTIYDEADAELRRRLGLIAASEQDNISKVTDARGNYITHVLKEGHSYADDCDRYYQEMLEAFLKELEKEMSIYLDELQNQIAARKEKYIKGSNLAIMRVMGNADQARQILYTQFPRAVEKKRQEIMNSINILVEDTKNQPVGYEQLKKIDIKMYSTVGTKREGQGCDNIPGRKAFMKDIHDAKALEPVKRTVYLGSNLPKSKVPQGTS